jgi:hypothetical protein
VLQRIDGVISSFGRRYKQSTSLYQAVPRERTETSFDAAPLTVIVMTIFSTKRKRSGIVL